MMKIYSEQPETDIWIRLSNYTYRNNIIDYFDEKNISDYDETIIDKISGALHQSKEYFDASKTSSMHISPLLLYYGYTNLMIGIYCLMTGKDLDIKNHGMNLNIPTESKKIGDVEINIKDKNNGALSLLAKFYSDIEGITQMGKIDMSLLFGAIPELSSEYVKYYKTKPSILPIERMNTSKGYIERINVKNQLLKDATTELFNLPQYKVNYMRTSRVEDYIILRKKLSGSDITYSSISGKRYFQLLNVREATISPIILNMMILFALSSLSRYQPQLWFSFVNNDSTGERLIIDKYLSTITRILPNYLLNFFENKELIYTKEVDSIKEMEKPLTQKELIELMDTRINDARFT